MKLPARLLRASLFVDTSAFYALADENDRFHDSALRFLESNRQLLVTSNLVVFETITLVRMRLGHEQAVKVGRQLLEGAVTPVLRILPADEERAWDMFKRFRDKRFSFVDCTSFTLIKRGKMSGAFAFDDDFRQVGGVTVYPLE